MPRLKRTTLLQRAATELLASSGALPSYSVLAAYALRDTAADTCLLYAEMNVAGPLGDVQTVSELVIDHAARTIDWRQLAGGLRVWQGEWKLIAADSATVVDYVMYFRLGTYVPGFLIRRALHRGIARLLIALEARAFQIVQPERRLSSAEQAP
jgi:ribosome-associated toxin RatA of RatAB toxin-antitoxin module